MHAIIEHFPFFILNATGRFRLIRHLSQVFFPLPLFFFLSLPLGWSRLSHFGPFGPSCRPYWL